MGQAGRGGRSGPGKACAPPRSRPALNTGKLLLLIQGLVLEAEEPWYVGWGGGQGQCLENLSPGNRYAVLGEPLMVGTGPGFMSPGDSEFLLQEKPFEFFQLYQ